jgi:hypothetical protein
MTTPDLKPLQRLLDSPDLSADLRADLTVAQSFEVPFDAAAGLARFQAHLDALPSGTGHAPLPPTAATGAAPSAALQLTGGKIVAALALAAGLGWGVLELTGGEAQKPAPTAQSADSAANAVERSSGASKGPAPVAQNQPATLPAAPPAPQAPASQAPASQAPASLAPASLAPARQSVEPVAKPSVGASQRSTAPRGVAAPLAAQPPVVSLAPVGGEPAAPSVSETAAAPSAADRLAKEVAQLSEVKQALRTDPARALALAETGHKEFADGALRQEREALALSALQKLGQTDALNARGAAFLKRYPQSSFASQVERMLGR